MFHKRLKILFVVLSVLTGVVTCRLWYIQISDGDRWQLLASATQVGEVPLAAIRGSLSDRDGVLLAQDRSAYTIKVYPSRFHEGSLLLAVRDVCVLLDLWPSYTPDSIRSGPLADLTLHVVRNPTLYAQQFLKQSADILQTETVLMQERGERIAPPVGWGEGGRSAG